MSAPASSGSSPFDGLKIGLAHARRGRRVFPVQPGTKQPYQGLRWQAEATIEEAEVIAWAKRYPGSAWAWALPRGLGVIDEDREGALEASGLVAPEGAPSQRTPRGRHYLVEGNDLAQGAGNVCVDVDTRVGERGYVVLRAVDSFDGEPVPAPDWFPRERGGHRTTTNSSEPFITVMAESPARLAIEQGELYIPKGQRDDTLTSLAGSLINAGATPEAAELYLETLNAAGAIEQPPGDRITTQDFQRIARSVARTHARNNPTSVAEASAQPISPIVVPSAEFLAEAAATGEGVEIVEGLIGDEGLGYFVGEPGSMKTMLTTQLGMCVANGLPFLGRRTIRTPVVYCGFEGATWRMADRLRRQAKGLGLADPGIYVAFKARVALDDPALLTDWAEAIAERAPCLVIVDPFTEAHSLEEVKDASRLLAGLRELQRAARGPLIVLHHPTKATDRSRANRLRGHGSFLGAADLVLWVERPNRQALDINLSSEKARDLEEPFSASLVFDSDTFLLHPSFRQFGVDELILRTITEHGEIDRPRVISTVVGMTGKSRRTIERAIKYLKGESKRRAGEMPDEARIEEVDGVLRLTTEWQRRAG